MATLSPTPSTPSIRGQAGMAPSALHRRRLRDVYRSAGWPCLDTIEVELLAAGFLERVRQPTGHEVVRVTDAGMVLIADTLQRNRARRDAHEVLVERVAREMTRSGRLAWRGLCLRAKVGDTWAMAMPDVFSVRHTTAEALLAPVVHEVKVRRADLLGDLRQPGKRAAYLQMAGECWYVIPQGLARAEEIPPECGVLVAANDRLDVARPAPRRAVRLPFDAWMALARATPMDGWRLEDAQACLGDTCDSGESATPGEPEN